MTEPRALQGRVAATRQMLVDRIGLCGNSLASPEITAIDPEKAEREALLRRFTLETPIVGGAGDDRAYPLQDLVAFARGPLREIAGESHASRHRSATDIVGMALLAVVRPLWSAFPRNILQGADSGARSFQESRGSPPCPALLS